MPAQSDTTSNGSTDDYCILRDGMQVLSLLVRWHEISHVALKFASLLSNFSNSSKFVPVGRHMTTAGQDKLAKARQQIEAASARRCTPQHVVDLFNSQARSAGHGETTVAEIELFLQKKHNFNGQKRSTLIDVCNSLETYSEKDFIDNNFARSNSVGRRLLEIENVQINRDDLRRACYQISGAYSCFYKSYERREDGEYFEVVRYNIKNFSRQSGYIHGQYTTLRMASDNLSPSDFEMILAPKRGDIASVEHANLLSVFHYDDREDKTIIYSLVRPVMIPYLKRCFLYGITVREDSELRNIIAYKVLWIPDMSDYKEIIPVGKLWRDTEMEESSLTFLKSVLDGTFHSGSHLYLEMGLDTTRRFRKIIEDYASKIEPPFIKLKPQE